MNNLIYVPMTVLFLAVSVSEAARVQVIRASENKSQDRTDSAPVNAAPPVSEERRPVHVVPRQETSGERRYGYPTSGHDVAPRSARPHRRVSVIRDPNPRSYSYEPQRHRSSYRHYYHHGRHWYGFHHGPDVYWTFWWNNHWWYRGPDRILYVHVNGDYTPYAPTVVTVAQPPEAEPPTPAPQDQVTPKQWSDSSVTSPDGRRVVQVVGSQRDAFLYDMSAPSRQAVFIKGLGTNVEKVRQTGGKDGKPLRFLVDYADGHFVLYDQDGVPVDTMSDVPANAPPPPPGFTPN